MEKQDIMWKEKNIWKNRISCGKERRNGKVGYYVERKEEMEKQDIMWKEKKKWKSRISCGKRKSYEGMKCWKKKC